MIDKEKLVAEFSKLMENYASNYVLNETQHPPLSDYASVAYDAYYDALIDVLTNVELFQAVQLHWKNYLTEKKKESEL